MDYQTVTQKLKDLGWNWIHPRVNNYISDLSRIHQVKYTPQSLPFKHYKKLQKLLECHERINQSLKTVPELWNHPEIIEFFEMYSKDNSGNCTKRLKLREWLQLEQLVVNLIPF